MKTIVRSDQMHRLLDRGYWYQYIHATVGHVQISDVGAGFSGSQQVEVLCS